MSAIPRPFTLLQSSRLPGGTFYGLNAQTIIGNSSGAWAITANGTNQNITLTPSGTGVLSVPIGTNTIQLTGAAAAVTPTFLLASGAAGRAVGLGAGSSHAFVNYDNSGQLQFYRSTRANILAGNTTSLSMALSTTGNLLLGGLTTDGTGVLQFAAATTNAGGITFGTDTEIFRSTTATLNITGHILSGGSSFYNIGNAGSAGRFATVYCGAVASGSGGTLTLATGTGSGQVIIQTASAVTALTLDSSQNATFTKEVKSTTGLHTATVTGTGASSYGGVGALTFYAKSVTILTSGGAGADIATITLPAGFTKYRVTNSSSLVVYAETASGTLAGASFQVRDTAGGAGTSWTSSPLGPTAAGLATVAVGNDAAATSTSGTIYIRQTANSANAGTCSFYVTVWPLP
tara:strand:- start:2618 stop:3829 length:1212 start_codon:yes stop_codon:yes gene_type:complete